jgi:hypothetical protein
VSGDGGWGGFLRSCEAPPAVESAGTLTAETVRRWLDELWQPKRSPLRLSRVETGDDCPPEPRPQRCRAVALAPDDSLRQAVKAEVIARCIPLHPVHAAYLNADVQGPSPLRCELEEHPAGTWHRDGRTWFR